LLALAILAVAVGSAYLLIVVPLEEFYLERQAIRADRGMLAARLVVAAKELPGLRTRLTKLRATASTSKVTLDGRTMQSPQPACKVASKRLPPRSA
jgi:hypothetical protein